MSTKEIKTIDVTALEWFDKINGNSYFAGYIVVNFSMDDERRYIMPYQYGYGDQYRYTAFDLLQKVEEIPEQPPMTSHWRYYQDNNIIVRHVKHENCKKRQLLAVTED